MKISICTVTRNRPASLRRTVLSILASASYSNFNDFEILIVDNSDNNEYLSNERICSLDQGIKQIASNSKVGIAALRQIGIKEACGEVIAFIDDDIEIPQEWFLSIVDAFQKDKQLGIYGCNVQNIGFDGKEAGYETRGLPKKLGVNGSLKPSENSENIVSFGESNLALRREYALEAGGFDRRFRWGYEGADLSQRLISRGYKVYYSKKIILKHYYNEQRFRPSFFMEKREYYRLLFFFRHFELKQFSFKYELKRIYYFFRQRNVSGAIFNILLLLGLPVLWFEAQRR